MRSLVKTIFANLCFVVAVFLTGCVTAEPTYTIDEALTAQAPWQVGEEIDIGVAPCNFDRGVKCEAYNQFLGVTPQGYYVIQSFYQKDETKGITRGAKRSDPVVVMTQTAVRTALLEGSIVGDYTAWYP